MNQRKCCFVNTNRWTWMDGDSSALASYGTQGMHSADNNPGARFSGISWTDSKDKFWLYSGGAIEKSILVHFEDLWRFSPPLSLPGKDSTGGDTTVIIISGDTSILAVDIKVFPNPFKNIVFVTSSKADSVAFITMYAINGLPLLRLNTLSTRTDINMSYYSAGVYVIIAEDKSHKRIGRKTVIKQ